ncbi:MAG: hypothetical protein ACI9LO_003589 [Planctomycetota bacterium]
MHGTVYANEGPAPVARFIADVSCKLALAALIGDVGVGLRLVSTRQSDRKVLHFDIAFPVSERDQVDSYQLFIKAKSEF